MRERLLVSVRARVCVEVAREPFLMMPAAYLFIAALHCRRRRGRGVVTLNCDGFKDKQARNICRSSALSHNQIAPSQLSTL